MTVRNGVVKQGQVVLNEPIPLPDGTPVTIRVEEAKEDPLLFIARNAVDLRVADGADEHNHYVYGSPKRTE